MKKFIVAEIRELESKVSKEEISYSRMVEIINEKAKEYYGQTYSLDDMKAAYRCGQDDITRGVFSWNNFIRAFKVKASGAK